MLVSARSFAVIVAILSLSEAVFSAGVKEPWSRAWKIETPKNAGAASMTMQMPLVAPLFIEDGDFTSELVIVNASLEKTYADVLLRDMDGHPFAQRRVTLSPTSQARVSIADMLHEAASAVVKGSVLVMPSGDLRGMAVAAQLTMTFRKYALPTYIDEELAMPRMEGSQDLRGIADAGNGSPVLSIVNLSEASHQLTITCVREDEPPVVQTLRISSYGATQLSACDHSVGERPTSASEAVEIQHGALGISLHTDGPPGSFAAFAINPHHQKDTIAYTSVPFSDPKMVKSSGVVFAGVPIGRVQLLADSGEYSPVLALANFGATPANVTMTFATSSLGQSPVSVDTLKRFSLPAASSMTLELKNLKSLSPLQNSLLIDSNGSLGQIAAKLTSQNESAGLVAELLAKDEKHPENAGLHPWSLERGSESTLLLFNHFPSANIFDVRIAAGNTTWQKAYTLRGFETLALNLRQLLLEQTKDDSGRVLPTNIDSGQLNWANTAGPHGTGRLLVSNVAMGMARSFSCGSFEDLCSVSISPTSTQTIAAGGSAFFNGSYAFCWQYNPGVCNGSPNGGGSAGLSWYAGDPLSGAGSCAGSTSCRLTTTSTSDGTGSVSFTASDSAGCTVTSPSVPVNVQGPLPSTESTSPSGETYDQITGDSDFRTIAGFVQTLSDAAGDSFSTRVVREQRGGNSDGCYFFGSAFDPYDLSTGEWTVYGANNSFETDWIGFTYSAIVYYMNQGRTPCTAQAYQIMQMSSGGNWVTYTSPYNALTIYVDDPTTSCKQENSGPLVCADAIYF